MGGKSATNATDAWTLVRLPYFFYIAIRTSSFAHFRNTQKSRRSACEIPAERAAEKRKWEDDIPSIIEPHFSPREASHILQLRHHNQTEIMISCRRSRTPQPILMLEFRRRGLELHRSCHVHESHRDFYLMHRCGGSMQETTIEKIERTHY
jgi:hypothetical protein